MDRLLTPEQVAEHLGVGVDWVRRRCQAGELEHLRLSGRSNGPLRISERALERFLAGRVVQAQDRRPASGVLAEIRRGRKVS